MTPGSLILLHSPGATAAAWGDLPEMLRSYGLDVIAPDIRESDGMRFIARASLVIAATAPTVPLVLVGHGPAGALLPAVAAAQRAAHRPVGGYVFVDADLPTARRPGAHDHEDDEEPAVPVPADWPEAPCGYLSTSDEHASQLNQARLRGWLIREHTARTGVAQSLSEIITTL